MARVKLSGCSLPGVTDPLQHFIVYESVTRYYIVGANASRSRYRLCKIDRTIATELNIDEDPIEYEIAEVNAILHMAQAGFAGSGGIKKVTHAYGILGFIKFLQGYYMILVTKRKKVGSFGAHLIYSIEDTCMVYLPHESAVSRVPLFQTNSIRADEARYKSLFMVTDLTKNFYFSYTYDLTNTLQQNMLAEKVDFKTKSMYIWNRYLMNNFCHADGGACPVYHDEGSDCLHDCKVWMLPIIHGFFEQMRCLVFSREITLTLLSRRSCLFAGTRYLKRGISDSGYVANDVETEQIIHDRFGHCVDGQYTSYVQLRASIPLFWSQDGNLMTGQPAIRSIYSFILDPYCLVYKSDPSHHALQLHIKHLFSRYGTPCLMVNLVRQSETQAREKVIGSQFGPAIDYINQFLPKDKMVDYFEWDYKKVSKSKTDSVIDELAIIGEWALQRTGVFHSNPRKVTPPCTHGLSETVSIKPGSSVPEKIIQPSTCLSSAPSIRPFRYSISPPSQDRSHLNIGWIQRGVLRSNCIDSLDRTNVAQFVVGKCALGYQLFAMGISSSNRMDGDSELISLLLEMYERMGDSLALQYGGSQMHRSMKKDRDKTTTMAPVLYRVNPPTASKELIVSIMRHYSNTFQDRVRQDAMNVLLGLFIPSEAFRDDVFIFAPIEPNTGFWGKFVSMIKGDEEEYFYEDRELEETNEQDVLPISKTKRSSTLEKFKARQPVKRRTIPSNLISFPAPSSFFRTVPPLIEEEADADLDDSFESTEQNFADAFSPTNFQYSSAENDILSPSLLSPSEIRKNNILIDSTEYSDSTITSKFDTSKEVIGKNNQVMNAHMVSKEIIDASSPNFVATVGNRPISPIQLPPSGKSLKASALRINNSSTSCTGMRRMKQRINVWDLVSDYGLHNPKLDWRAYAYYDTLWWKDATDAFDATLIKSLSNPNSLHFKVFLDNFQAPPNAKIFFPKPISFPRVKGQLNFPATLISFDSYLSELENRSNSQILDLYGSSFDSNVEADGSFDNSPYYARPKHIRISGSIISKSLPNSRMSSPAATRPSINKTTLPVVSHNVDSRIVESNSPSYCEVFLLKENPPVSTKGICHSFFRISKELPKPNKLYESSIILSDQLYPSFYLLPSSIPSLAIITDILSIAGSSVTSSSVMFHIKSNNSVPIVSQNVPFGAFGTGMLPLPSFAYTQGSCSGWMTSPLSKPRLRYYTKDEGEEDVNFLDHSSFCTLKYAEMMKSPFVATPSKETVKLIREASIVSNKSQVLGKTDLVVAQETNIVDTANSVLEHSYANSVYYKNTSNRIERLNYLGIANSSGNSEYISNEIKCYVDYCYNMLTEDEFNEFELKLFNPSVRETELLSSYEKNGYVTLESCFESSFSNYESLLREKSVDMNQNMAPIGVAFVEEAEFYQHYLKPWF